VLEHRRLNYDLMLLYKILNGLIDVNLSNSFQFQQSNIRGHGVKLVKPYCSHDISKYFFCNSLLSDVVLAKSLHAFKRKLHEIDSLSLCFFLFLSFLCLLHASIDSNFVFSVVTC